MNKLRYAGLRLASALLLAALLPWSAGASAATTWQDVRSSMALRGIASNGTLYVGAAQNGIWTSSDLKTWTQVSLPASAGATYNDVLWDGSRFIAVGAGLISSTDGSNWTVGFAASSGQLWNAIALSSGNYVVVGSDATSVLRSTDGQKWTPVSTGFTVSSFSLSPSNGSNLSLSGIASNGSGFVAMGYQYSTIGDIQSPNADIMATSSDGSTWSPATLPSNPNGLFDVGAQNNVAWGTGTGPGIYVAGGGTGVYTSPNGTTWTLVNFPPPSGGTNEWLLTRIAYSNGQFIGVGVDFNSGEYIALTSPDGAAWTEHNVAVQQQSFQGLDAIVTVGTGYAVGGDYAVYTTTDLTTWSSGTSLPAPGITGCIVDQSGKFVMLGNGGSLSSAGGTSWPAALNKGTGIVLQAEGSGQGCAAFGSGTFVAIDAFGANLLGSADGATWGVVANRSSAHVTDYSSVAFTGSGFVAVGDYNTGVSGQPLVPVALTSSDGKTWTAVSTTGLPAGIVQFGAPLSSGSGLVYANGKLVAWGSDNTNAPFVAVSGDGKAWSTASIFSAGDAVSAIAFGNGSYIALGYDGSGNTLAASSSDAQHWTQISGVATGMHANWLTLIWGNNEFVAGGLDTDLRQGVIFNSSDGKSWTSTTLGSASGIGGIEWNGTSYVAVSLFDVFEYTPPAPPSTGGGGGTGGGSGGGSAPAGKSGGGAFDILALSLLSGLAIRRRERWMRG